MTQSTNENLKRGLKYTASILMFICVLAAIPKDKVAILPFLIAGLIFFPPLEKLLLEKFPVLTKRPLRILIFFFALILGTKLIDKKNNNHNQVSTESRSNSSSTESNNRGESTSKQRSYSKDIPGILPVDVYGNFDKIGFNTTKQISHDGSFWISELEEKGMSCNVRTYCESGVNEVNHIRLNIIRTNPQYNEVESMKPFLKYGCSIPFDGNDPSKVNQFIDENFYTNKASIVISGVRFTIYVPSEFTRMIDIEKD